MLWTLELIKYSLISHVDRLSLGSRFVSKRSWSRVSISSLAKSKSRQSRKSRHCQKVSFNNRDISILSRHHLPVPKVSIEIEKSVKTWYFWKISTVCLHLNWELVNFITFLNQDFSICLDFWSWSTSKSLNKSQKVVTNLENLDSFDLSWQSRQKSQQSLILIEKSWFSKSRRFSKVCLDTKDILDLDLNWSQLLRPPCLW
jgi:hypothetical protein